MTSGGDVIVAVNGQPVRSAEEVVRDVGSRLPGETIRLTVVRRRRRRKTSIAKLGARPEYEIRAPERDDVTEAGLPGYQESTS